MDIRQEVAALIGHAVTDIAPLGGGCVSAVYELRLDDGRRLVVKHDEAGAGGLLGCVCKVTSKAIWPRW